MARTAALGGDELQRSMEESQDGAETSSDDRTIYYSSSDDEREAFLIANTTARVSNQITDARGVKAVIQNDATRNSSKSKHEKEKHKGKQLFTDKQSEVPPADDIQGNSKSKTESGPGSSNE